MIRVSTIAQTIAQLAGSECWYVNAGGPAGASFSLAFGEKVPRSVALKNPAVSPEFRAFEGAYNLYVWCSWRLETEDAALASSDQDVKDSTPKLETLMGRRLVSIEADPRSLDLKLQFDDRVLRVFCDHVAPNASYDANWELYSGGRCLRAGPGFDWTEEEA